jgi:ATPase subunit of ABC transporter with duplicated ATPase domains
MEIKAEHIHKSYGGYVILDDISFSLSGGMKVGLVGGNGSGKSTLLKIIAGQIEPDAGTIEIRRDAVVGYMPQDTSVVGEESVREYLRQTSGMARLEEGMGQSSDALAEYERRDGYAFYGRMEAVLAGFGLDGIADRSLNTLSSGQKSKVFMAGVLLSDPDILLLDEPTNNLDLPALLWFEQFLAGTEMTCLMVSHDQAFLDRLVRKIFEIDWMNRTLTVTNGKYTDFLERKRKGHVRQLQKFEEQREEIGRLTEAAQAKRLQSARGARYQGTDNDKFLRGFKRDRAGSSGKVAKVIEKRIEQMEKIERPITRDAFKIDLEAKKVDGSRDIVLSYVVAGYPDTDVRIGPVNFSIHYGNRLLILGLNGTGKSTFVRTVSGELTPISGAISRGTGLVIGNFTQEHHDLPRDKTLEEFLTEKAKLSQEHVYALAKKYGFSELQIRHPISDLSPGGRARLLFALFTALSVNVLLLDEPTNHLDIEALDALEEMLRGYEGSVIAISHDRHFLSVLRPSDTYSIERGSFKRIADIDDYIDQASQHAVRILRRAL